MGAPEPPPEEGGAPAGGRPPALGRGDLDRVIRRAVELQFLEGEDEEGRVLTEDEVLRIGREVGVEERHLRRALGELRADALLPAVPDEPPLVERYMGPATVRASRVVPGEAREVEEKLAEHFRAGESLTRIRSRQGRSRWEPAEGMLAELQRGLRWKGYRYDLAKARSVDLTVTPLEDGYSLVAVSADLRGARAGNVFGQGAMGGFMGGGAGVGLGLILAGGWIVALPGALIGGGLGTWSGRSAHLKDAERIRLAIEGILDRLEAGEPLARKSKGLLGSAGLRPPLPPGRGGV